MLISTLYCDENFKKGCLVLFIPLFVLLIPLFFHSSPDHEIANYSKFYVKFVLVLLFLSVVLSAVIGYVSMLKKNLNASFLFVFIVFCLFVCCLVTEVALTYKLRHVASFAQYTAWGHKKSALFGFEATPNFRWDNAGATYTTDKYGFRTHVNNPWENEKGFRIFTIGESATFGLGLQDNQTWSHSLENILRGKLKCHSINVINAGNNGHTSIQTFYRLYLKVLPHKPSHVILYAGNNDVQSFKTPLEYIWASDGALFSGSLIDYWANESKGKNIYVRSLLFYTVINTFPSLKKFKPLSIPEGFACLGAYAATVPGIESFNNETKEVLYANSDNFLRNVRSMYLLCRAEGVNLILTTFIHNLYKQDSYRALCIDYQNELLREFAQSNGVRLIDLEKMFANVPNKESYFHSDSYHPYLKGAEFISSSISNELTNDLKNHQLFTLCSGVSNKDYLYYKPTFR